LYASLFFVWALLICYAQVYVGVHYPLDVIGGGVLGIIIGTLSAGFFQRRIRLEPELTT
jgi:undecaprenyl-diphosphatase